MGNSFDACCAPNDAQSQHTTQSQLKRKQKVLSSFQSIALEDDQTKDGEQQPLRDTYAEVEDKKEEEFQNLFQIELEQSDKDDMAKCLWDGPEDSDEEIASIVKYKNEFEKKMGIKFSKKGIIKYIEEQVQKESIEANPSWEMKDKDAQMSYYLKRNGSKFNKTQPFFRSETTYAAPFKLNLLPNYLYHPKYTKTWDENVEDGHLFALDKGKLSYGLCYLVNGKKFTFDARDYVEKYIQFYDSGKYYRYGSSIPNEGYDVEPARKKTIRAETLINCAMLYRTHGQKIKQVHLCQVDFKIEVPQWLLTQFLPGAAKKWMAEAKKFYQKNYKKDMQEQAKKIQTKGDKGDDSRKLIELPEPNAIQ